MSRGESHFKNKDKIVAILKLFCLSTEDRASISKIEATYLMAICKTKWQTVYFIRFYKTTLPQNRIKIVYFTVV